MHPLATLRKGAFVFVFYSFKFIPNNQKPIKFSFASQLINLGYAESV